MKRPSSRLWCVKHVFYTEPEKQRPTSRSKRPRFQDLERSVLLITKFLKNFFNLFIFNLIYLFLVIRHFWASLRRRELILTNTSSKYCKIVPAFLIVKVSVISRVSVKSILLHSNILVISNSAWAWNELNLFINRINEITRSAHSPFYQTKELPLEFSR